MDISIIISAHNYGKYLAQCIESARKQNYFGPYEIIIVDDGSTDHTAAIIEYYLKVDDRIVAIKLPGKGLAAACNAGILAARGRYIIRLDADDYFDENILLVQSNILNNNPCIGMVYADYYHVDQYGQVIEHVRLPKIHDEITLLDRSPLAAGAMYRRTCYDAIGGYNETLRYQEDYDFWIRFVEKFNVYNVNLPLMYYRKHGASMSTSLTPRMATRRRVKREFIARRGHAISAVGVVLARDQDWKPHTLALRPLAGKPVVQYTLRAALQTTDLERVIISTDSPEIAEFAKSQGAEVLFLRPKNLALPSVSQEEVLRHALEYLWRTEDYLPEVVVALQVNSPLRRSDHIQEALDTIRIHAVDSVVSVTEDISFLWTHGKTGLEPLFYQKGLLRKDREKVYRENGAVYVYNSELILRGEGLGEAVGHIEMLREESLRIHSSFDFSVVEYMLGKMIA